MKKIVKTIEHLERFVSRWWYGPLLFTCSGLDHYVGVFPILGMLASSVLLTPKKWISFSFWSALGSWLGAAILAWLTQAFGVTFIQNYFPIMLENSLWNNMQDFFYQHGIWLLFLVGIAPLPQQPAVIIVALAGTPLAQMALILLIAKILKFGLIGYLASHAPQRLRKLRDVRGELEELHIHPAAQNPTQNQLK